MLRELPLNEIYSIIFYAAATTYILVGVYILTQSVESKLNQIFFLMTISLGIWAFSYSIATSATTYHEALMWHRVSSLGWGIMYSILLHFFLILTNRYKLLENKMTYVILYFPALINIFYFGINTKTAATGFNVIQTSSGWVDASTGGILNIYFYTYYLAFTIAGFIVIWTWDRIRKENRAKGTAVLITITMLLGITLGSLTDLFFTSSILDPKLNMGVVFSLIPISSIILVFKKHGIIQDESQTDVFIAGNIFTKEKRMNFFKMISYVFIAGSISYVILDYIMIGKEITSVLKFSGIVLFIGVYLRIMPHSGKDERSQDIQLGIVMALVTPILYLHYMQYGYNSVIWSVPIFLMILSIVFNNRIVLIMTLVSAALVETVSAARNGSFVVTIGRVDYQQRLAIYFLLAGIVYYISHIYRQRLDEHEKQIEVQREVSRISSEFVGINSENIDARIDDVLRMCGTFFGIDHAFMFRLSNDMSVAHYTNEWCADGIPPTKGRMETLNVNDFPWWMKQLKSNTTMHISELAELPLEAQEERQLMTRQNIKSMSSISIVNQNKTLGILGFNAIRKKSVWKPEHQEVLQILTNMISDALVKIEAEKKINQMAYYDNLTNLPNRIYFNMELDQMLKLAKRNERLVGVLFLDLDLFKSINDSLGHEAGDKLLVTIGERLTSLLRESDMACRFGGDEFLIMLPHMKNHENIRKATEKIMRAFEEPVTIDGQDFYVTASSGVAVYPLDGEDSETLVKNADLAMYESKSKGKNRYTFCTPIMKEEIREKVQLSNDLYRALEREELVLYYQPQLSIETGKIIGLEALIRWMHPERGMISPGVFIPMAEQTGLIQSIGDWVIKTASRQNKIWQQEGYDPVAVAVNISVEQFRGSQLVEVVSEALKESKLEPQYLELEITESIAIQEPDYIIGVLERLKSLGVSIAIDDFGTEYSSLSRLKELPVDKLKMAMEFVQGIDKDSKDKAIATVIINLAKSLGLRVIAEGVEKKGQLDFLRDRACDEAQGYYFYRPMPVEEVEKIL
ncbi:EAL domain-containing protein [Gudongella sp. DL1XJH-153]|uniref:EAL domain-containing protein n=1 Tax=Gudongella sp. DL1XJH-153 TaxID=3409804 RepID=UPI003BB69B93